MNLFKKAKEIKSKSKDELGKELDGLITGANMQGSNLIAKMFLTRLSFGYDSSSKFANSEEQTDSFLDKYPSMIMYRQEIIDKAKKFRKENGLVE